MAVSITNTAVMVVYDTTAPVLSTFVSFWLTALLFSVTCAFGRAEVNCVVVSSIVRTTSVLALSAAAAYAQQTVEITHKAKTMVMIVFFHNNYLGLNQCLFILK